jgi:carboxylate-amine ligase
MGASVEDSYAALAAAREHFERATDFTIGIEEEFQILDADSLLMTNRFEELRDACEAGVLKGHVAGELIASEIEVKTGRGETFDEAARMLIDRRIALVAEAERLGVAVGSTGTHPTSPWTDQRIIDTPHYRIVEGTLRYIAWRNNTFGMHVHVGIRNADRAMAVANAMRTHVPELLALSCTSPWLEGRITHLRSTRTQIFTRMFPRCGIPDVFTDWADYDRYVRFLLETESIREHTEIWWTVRPHQSFGTVEIRACDALPDIADSLALAALQVALTARAARRYDAGDLPAPTRPSDIEENLWRALRWGMSRELIDLEARKAIPADEHLANLLAACQPEIDALGLAPWLTPLAGLLEHGDHATRWKDRVEAGEDMSAIHAEQVAITMTSAHALKERIG